MAREQRPHFDNGQIGRIFLEAITELVKLSAALDRLYGICVQAATQIRYGIWEECWDVQSDRGRLFAKRFLRRDRSTEKILRGLYLSERIRRMGFPAPELVPTLDGDLIGLLDGDRYQVNVWVEGICLEPGRVPEQAAAEMGRVLGTFHRLAGPAGHDTAQAYPSRDQALRSCETLLARYTGRSEPFAQFAVEILQAQIGILACLPPDIHEQLPKPTMIGTCYGSFWCEQLLFNDALQAVAVVDWTDGAGGMNYIGNDIDVALHLSALDLEGVRAFAEGYQREHPLPVSEWRAVCALLCYGHLASTNFLSSWLQNPYKDVRRWESVSRRWHESVPRRFNEYNRWEAAVVDAVTAVHQSGRADGAGVPDRRPVQLP